MKLPKVNPPNIFAAVSLLLIFSLLFPRSTILAQKTTEPLQQNTYTQRVETGQVKEATTSTSVASDEKGKVKLWFVAIGAAIGVGILLEELFGPGIIGKGVDCVKDFHKCVEGAVIITQNVVYKQTTGCDFSVPDAGGKYPDDCSQENAQAIATAIQNGNENIELPHGGLLQVATNITNASFEVPVPVDSTQYFASINPFTTARAQDATTDIASQLGAHPMLLEIWQRIRDASYALLVVVLIIIGFLIMVRWKYDSRTAVTMQNSLPRLAIALLLITFSFAIAGLMADLIRVLTSVVLDLIPGPNFNMVAMVLLAIASATVGTAGALAFLSPTIAMIALLLFALFMIAIVISVFINVIFKIVTRYVIFILLTLFAPLFFLLGALPGADGIMISWFKRAAAALVAIPAVAFVIKLSFAIGFSSFPLAGVAGASSQGSVALPSIWFLPNPVHSVLQWTILGPIVGIGIFFFATKVPEIVDAAFDIKPLPRGGIGPGAILGAPFAGMMMAGNVSKAMRNTAGIREGAGNILRNRGWGKTPSPINIKGGIPANELGPARKDILAKTGGLGPEVNVPGGLDLSNASPDWKRTLQRHDMIRSEPAPGEMGPPPPSTKAGTIQQTLEGGLQLPAEKTSGVSAAAARTAVSGSLGQRALGVKPPQQSPSFRTTEQIRENDQAAATRAGGAPPIPGKTKKGRGIKP